MFQSFLPLEYEISPRDWVFWPDCDVTHSRQLAAVVSKTWGSWHCCCDTGSLDEAENYFLQHLGLGLPELCAWWFTNWILPEIVLAVIVVVLMETIRDFIYSLLISLLFIIHMNIMWICIVSCVQLSGRPLSLQPSVCFELCIGPVCLSWFNFCLLWASHSQYDLSALLVC